MSIPSASALYRPVRAGFQAAIDAIQAYPVERTWRPAFMAPLSTLPQARRASLRDRAGLRPAVRPFAKQPFTIAQAGCDLRAGRLTVVELVERMLAAIDERQATLNAFVYVAGADALRRQAEALDVELRRGGGRTALHGIPIAVKDLLDVAAMPNTAGSPVLDHHISAADAGSVRQVKAAGALIMGKTHTHEFALGATTPQSRNPWDPTRDPGGSSGGSAIAVAAGMSLGALATDTRASARVPAALCGIVGYKPTYGLVPADGLITLSWSLDHIAHVAATVEDAALLLDVLDPAPHVRYSAGLNKEMAGVRVGIPEAALAGMEAGVAAAFRQAADALAQAGVEVVRIDTPSAEDFDLAVLTGLVITRAEAAAYHTAFGDSRHRYALPSVAEQLDEATQVSAVDYLQAQRVREDLRWRMLRLLEHYDALLMPTTRLAAPKSDEADNYHLVLAQNCIPWSLIGFPAITLPCGLTPARLPAGAQLVAAPFEDARLLAIAAALELELGAG